MAVAVVTPTIAAALRSSLAGEAAGVACAGCGCQLRALLAEPEMVALLAASPRAVRTLKPLCRMLGVDLPLPPAPVPPKQPAVERWRLRP